ncbi:MAG: hypothetical protein ACRDHG_02165, partial [Anaerolineales bacterium]
LASAFPRLMLIGLEAIGKGEEFAELVQRAGVFLPLMPIPGHAGLARSKGGRFEKVMAPMFQRREVMLSTKSTDFLQHFVDEWVSFDGRDRRGLTDDCLDGVYMLIQAAAGYLSKPTHQVRPRTSAMYRADYQRRESPLAGWGRELRGRD